MFNLLFICTGVICLLCYPCGE